MSTQRTPPNLSAPRLSGTALQVSSEGDISKLEPDHPLHGSTRRSKRPRKNDEVTFDDTSLKEELLQMLSNWKKDQDLVLNKLCTDIAELKQQNSSIKSISDELEKSLKFVSLQYEDMKDKLQDMERERKEHINLISNLECRLDELQKRTKFTVLEFRNIPQQIRQETQLGLCELIQNTCKSFNTYVEPSDIKDIFRISSNTGASTIVTDFTSVLTKNKILDGIKVFNKANSTNKLSTSTIGLPGPVKPVYIAESLSSRDRRLFAMARDAARTLAFKYCWTRRGKIFIRRGDGDNRIEIKNEADITTLKNK